MTEQLSVTFENSYARLPEHFYARLDPTPVASPGLVRVNHALAKQLGIDPLALEAQSGLAVLAGNQVPDGAEPLAMAYAGHQFGSWVPQLGDGRAILLGEVLDVHGTRYDIQLKGSGPTPYSRMGDGRAPLGPVLREYIVSEAMATLGIPTTRALAAVTTGNPVLREDVLPGAILTRVARSHIRVGTFQYYAARQDTDALRPLAKYVIDRHYPAAAGAESPTQALLAAVIDSQARLIARWQLIGFIHGVMNTDNMLLCGETIDYGPCAFMDAFHPDTVFSSIDRMGRYAYRNQPGIAHWNLACLAQALLPVLADTQQLALAIAQEAVDAFPLRFEAAYRDGLIRKIGLMEFMDGDEELFADLLQLMADTRADFTLSFRRLADLANAETNVAAVGDIFELPEPFEPWLSRWRQRLATDLQSASARQQSMYAANPAFIPRNHLVEETINAAVNENDFGPFHRLVDVLASPFSYDPGLARFAIPASPEQAVQQTFCGT